jgi:integrase
VSPAAAIKLERSKAKVDRRRQQMVSPALSSKIVKELPDTKWKLAFCLLRYQGMRRHELFNLQWSHVLWHENNLQVHSTKTGYRECPIFHETATYLRDAFEIASPGQTHVIPWQGNNESITTLMRKHIAKIVGEANVWPKILQQLRSVRRTELEKEFPRHVVNEWLGHDSQTAEAHYLQITDDDKEKAKIWQTEVCVPLGVPVLHRNSPHSPAKTSKKPKELLIPRVLMDILVPPQGFKQSSIYHG